MPNSFQNHPKTLPKPTFKNRRAQNASQNRFFERLGRFLSIFLEGPGPPEPPKMEPKPKKTCKNSIIWKSMFLNTIFHRNFIVLASKYGTKIGRFSIIFWKRRFCKNRAPVEAKLLFLRFRAFKNRPKIDAKAMFEKNLEKNIPKIEFGTILGSQSSSNIDPKSKKVASKTESKKRPQGRTEPRAPSTHPTPQTKPKRLPKSHPFT